MKKKYITLLFLTIFIVFFSAGCSTLVLPPASFQGNHVVWICVDDPVNYNLKTLLRDVDVWIDSHPNVVVVNVQIVNATLRNVMFTRAVYPSGAMIVFRDK